MVDKFYILLLNLAFFVTSLEGTPNKKIDHDVLVAIQEEREVSIVLWFDGVKKTLAQVDNAFKNLNLPKAVRNVRLVSALEEKANVAQHNVRKFLIEKGDKNGFTYWNSYWTSNKLFVKDASPRTIYLLVKFPEVTRIQKEPILQVPSFDDDSEENVTSLEPPKEVGRLWSLSKIQVVEAWNALDGNKGDGVVVATIDTGVTYTHDILRDNFIGFDYGWFDGVMGSSEAYDPHGHGTHVTGTLAGADGVGVAPGAKWMTCRACETSHCHYEHILNCFKFVGCPFLPDATNRNCSKAPNVLSFSILGDREGSSYEDDFMTLRALGIITVVAVGNNGPQCASTLAPSNNNNVIAVGATDYSDTLSFFSSIGPSPDGSIKPDLVAPGAWIWSADFGSVNLLMPAYGMSSAPPHVAGVVALLHVKNPRLTFEEAYNFLTENTDKNVTISYHRQNACNVSATDIPNNFIGYGRISAIKVIEAQLKSMGFPKPNQTDLITIQTDVNSESTEKLYVK